MKSELKSEYIKEILTKIEKSIDEGIFVDVEKSKIELKDLSTGGDWKSLKETICAFLNSSGGIVICGVNEKNKRYKFTGFSRTNESKIIQLQSDFFKNDNDVFIDLSENILFDYENFLDGEVSVIIVKPLSEDKKFVKVDDKYYERKLTQDKVITTAKIQHQKEYKTEIENA